MSAPQKIVITGKRLKESKNSTPQYKKNKFNNVLNSYRSITYNFTLAALSSEKVSKPEEYQKSEQNFIILKSGGKGAKKITSDVVGIQRKIGSKLLEQTVDEFGNAVYQKTETVTKMDYSASELVRNFNKKSPGRFDMFIDNIEIETLMTFNQSSNMTLPNKIKFDVIEPYSINGFIEALHVAAVAAGYTSYVNASFLLKVEFWGIPDDDEKIFKEPEIIPNSTRYFPIGFTGIDVELTDVGTKYRCNAIPYSERAFGQPSLIKKSIKMEGNTVGEILNNFIKKVNDQQQQSVIDGKEITNEFDEYKIKFVEWSSNGWEEKNNTEISSSPIQMLYEDNVLYNFVNPSDSKSTYKKGTVPQSINYNPSNTVVNFPENKSIHDVITAVIRDSLYVRSILKDLAENSTNRSNVVDDEGRIKYFSIRIEVENKKIFNSAAKRPCQIYTFVISPYKVHFTRVPTYGQVQLNENDFKKSIIREYNYFYMGNNIDVLNFKLNFNTLFFEAIPASMGKQNYPDSRDAVNSTKDQYRILKSPKKTDQLCNNINHPMHPIYEQEIPILLDDGNSIPSQNDPYSTLAKTMHNAITDSKASMVTGSLEILGDPVYLITGGIGAYNPKPKTDSNEVGEGEANNIYGEVSIAINFRNPIDINDDVNGSSVIFDPNRVPFSGVYMVKSVVSSFKGGIFKQSLDVLRRPGQILDSTCKEITPDSLSKSKVNDDGLSVGTVSTNFKPVNFANDSNIATILNRASPTNEVNHTNALGGLGGTDVGATIASRAYGLVSSSGQLLSGAGVIGQSLPSIPTTDIRLKTTQLSKLFNTSLSPAALLNSAVNIATGNTTLKSTVAGITGKVLGASISDALSSSNIGSGIGEGATKFIDSVGTVANDTVKNIYNAVSGISENTLEAAKRLGADAEELIGDIKNKIDSTVGSLSDPNAVASKLGLDTAKLSGLSSNLKSKISDEIKSLENLIPKNTNLSQYVKQGLALDTISKSKFPNIPPNQPYSVAPEPDVKVASFSQLNPFSEIREQFNNVDATIIKDKFNSVKQQLQNFSKEVNIPDKFSSSSLAQQFSSKSFSSPLDKLVNNLNDPNAEPYTGTDPIVRNRLGLPPIEED